MNKHKIHPTFLPNGFAIPFISQPTAHPGYPPAAAEIRFTELPSCRLKSISRTVIFLCASQSYRRTRSPFRLSDRPHCRGAQKSRPRQGSRYRPQCLRHTRNVNRNTGCSHDRQKTIQGDQRHQCRTERNHHIYADRRLSCVSAAPHRSADRRQPQRSAAPNRSFEYFPAYASPSRIKTIAQTTDTASPGRSVCRYRPLRAYRIPSRKHGIPSGLRFPPET